MARAVNFDLPENLDPASKEFIETLNDRLRRLSDELADLRRQIERLRLVS